MVLACAGLVDFNPSGMAILSVYKFGSYRGGLEAPRSHCLLRSCVVLSSAGTVELCTAPFSLYCPQVCGAKPAVARRAIQHAGRCCR